MRSRPLIAAAVVLAGATRAQAVDYAGTYRGPTLAADLSAVAGGYAGTLHLGDRSMPCRAKPDGDHLSGTFDVEGTSFPFTATLAGDALTLSSGGRTYALTRGAAATRPIATVTYKFPDGSGTIDLPPGWSCQSEGIGKGVQVKGPGGESVAYNAVIWAINPTTPAPIGHDRPFVGPRVAFAAPADALTALLPELDRMARAAGQPEATLGRFRADHPLQPTAPRGLAALLDYDWTWGRTPYRSVSRVECVPGGSAAAPWHLAWTELAAPADRFDAAAAGMAAVLRSLHPDEDAIRQAFDADVRRARRAWGSEWNLNDLDEQNRAEFEADRHARQTRMAVFERFYPAWAGHGDGGATGPQDLADLDPHPTTRPAAAPDHPDHGEWIRILQRDDDAPATQPARPRP